jgi:hypothetical protein
LVLAAWFGGQPAEQWFDDALVLSYGGALSQNTRYDDDDTFYGGVVTSSGGLQTVTQNTLYTDSDTFYAGSLRQAISAALYTDPDTFYAGQLVQRVNGGLYTDPDTFYAGALSGRISASSLYTDADTYYTGSLAQTASGALYEDADTFYGGTVASNVTVTQSALFDDGDTFYGGTVTGGEVTQTVVRGGVRFKDAQAEWEARQDFRKQAVQIIERLDEAPQEAPVTVETVAEVAPRFSLVEAMSEGVELGLDIDPILLALQARNAMQAEQTAMVLLAAIEQEREAIALAWFMAEAA